jgi:oligopeptidase B
MKTAARELLIALVTLSLVYCVSLGNGGKIAGMNPGKEPIMQLAPKRPVKLEKHGDVRVDEYFWMNERDSAPVMEYLKGENLRTEETLADMTGLKDRLVAEMRSRVKEDDISVPVKDGDFYYQTRYEKGKEYPIFLRRRGSPEAAEQIMGDVNAMAAGHSYYSCPGTSVSPNHKIAAFPADAVGRRFYTISFKNLDTGEWLPDKLPDTTGNLVWANDNKTVFFTKQHPETLRAYRIYRYELGGAGAPVLIYEEKDETFSVHVDASKDNVMLFINSWSTLTSESRFLSADTPMGEWQVFHPREREHEYSIVWGGDRFYILTNWRAKNFRLMDAPIGPSRKENWKEVVPHRDDVYLEAIDAYRGHLVLEERFNGLSRLVVRDRKTGHNQVVEFPDPTYVTSMADLPEYDSPVFRYTYESLVRPPSVFDFHFAGARSELRKEREVPGYDRTKYQSQRLWARAPDGTMVPISYLALKDRSAKPGPLMLYGYGSYGYSMDPHFNSNIFSLVDRGFGYAIGHIRGGSEMGRKWYDDGKLLKKRNTFTDFIACAEHLIGLKLTSPKHLYIMGGSAGGLLMGAVVNMRPDLFNGVVAAVPFVDVVTTMLDDTIPLTTSEYDEWGNPNDPEFYKYMKSYSPYDNVESKEYPNILVTTGYHDSQVQYWEPAKWVARLRERKTDKNFLLFKTELATGHSGASGRFERLKEVALNYVFFLKLEGITK